MALHYHHGHILTPFTHTHTGAQADMIAFRGRDEGIQCGFPNRYASEILTDLGMSILGTCMSVPCGHDTRQQLAK